MTIMQKTIGNFDIQVFDPWPCRCVIKVNRTEIWFSHTDLPDLKHVINEMIRSAIEQLPEGCKGEAAANG